MILRHPHFSATYSTLSRLLTLADTVDVGEWHAQDVSNNPQLVTRELRNVVVEWEIPSSRVESMQRTIKPNLPWAEDQFLERVGGEPLNPPPSAAWWPYAQRGHEDHLDGGKFSHTYPERMWPRYMSAFSGANFETEMQGIRYRYGDLNDVVNMLVKSPYTRQAYLPIWFPEDTGNYGVRLPCSLGYHFLLRNGKLNCTYFIRSVDFVRHFRDDFYMAARLCQWVLAECKATGQPEMIPDGRAVYTGDGAWHNVTPGTLTMHMISLHCMEGDLPMMRRQNEDQ